MVTVLMLLLRWRISFGLVDPSPFFKHYNSSKEEAHGSPWVDLVEA